MSVRTMARVWELGMNRGNDLLMLLAIADFADDDGNAYPSVQTLAQKCRMKQRNANAILATLRGSGELEVKLNEGPRGTNRYHIVLPSPTLQESTGMRNRASSPARTCSKPLRVSVDESSLNLQEPSVHVCETTKPFRSFNAKTYLFALNVPEQIASDWLSLRKTKRALTTKTAIDGIKKQADKAGNTLDAALTLCCERGWQGFRADWIKDDYRQQDTAK